MCVCCGTQNKVCVGWCLVCVFVFVFVDVSPYSSVVEHPLSKRKVGSSILPGGKLLAPQIDKRTTKRTSRSFVACGLYTALDCRIDERLDTPVGLDASLLSC